jgi:hypothetical protein
MSCHAQAFHDSDRGIDLKLSTGFIEGAGHWSVAARRLSYRLKVPVLVDMLMRNVRETREHGLCLERDDSGWTEAHTNKLHVSLAIGTYNCGIFVFIGRTTFC